MTEIEDMVNYLQKLSSYKNDEIGQYWYDLVQSWEGVANCFLCSSDTLPKEIEKEIIKQYNWAVSNFKLVEVKREYTGFELKEVDEE